MANFSFSDVAPIEYLAIPEPTKEDNAFALILKNFHDHMAMTRLEKTTAQTETQYAATVMDDYLQTPHGQRDWNELRDMSYRMSMAFTEAFDILTNRIAPRVASLIERIDALSDKKLERTLGYQNKDGSYTKDAQKLFLLDVEQLFTQYRGTSFDFASRLCSKYKYNVEYLNDRNVTGLLGRIAGPQEVILSPELFNAIYKDVVVNVTSTPDGDIVIDTNEPDAVKGDNVTTNVHKDDESSSSSTDPEPETTEPIEESDNNVNVSVSSTTDAEVNITINDESISTEEAETMKAVLSGCLSKGGFDLLKKKLFSDAGQVTHKNLLSSLLFVKWDITSALMSAAEKYCTAVQREQLKLNLEAIRELQQGAIVFLDISAIRFADKLIIGPTLLNKNLVNKAMDEGIDIIPQVRNYLRVYHNYDQQDLYYGQTEHKVITTGVTYAQVLAATYTVEQRLVNAKQATQQEYTRRIKDCRMSAFREVMAAEVREIANTSTDDQLGLGANNKTTFIDRHDQYVNHAAKRLAGDENANIEDTIYELMLEWYRGTLVEDIYTHLQEGVRARALSGVLDDKALAMVKAEVVATLGADYIFKNFF